MKVKILRGTIVNGKPAFPNEVIEVNDATGAMLVRSGKAALVDQAEPLNNVVALGTLTGEPEGLTTKSAKPITRAETR